MTLEKLVKTLSKIATKNQIHPQELTKTMVLSSETELTEWTLRKFGGLRSIINTHFPVTDKSLKDISEMRDARSYISKLEKQLGNRENFEKQVLDAIVKIKPLPKIKSYKPKSKLKEKREMNAILSDQHYGIHVDPDAVGNVNKYNWLIAGRRTAMIVDELINYKKDKRDTVEALNLFLGGDVIGGLIHDTNYRNIDLLIHQQNGALHILGHAIGTLIPHFKKINVYCLAGNHDDNVTKRNGGRVLTEKFDSFINHTYYALSAMFRNNQTVKFVIPKSTYVMHDGIGGRVMMTHGDVMFSRELGNPGTNINVKSLSNAINRFNSGELIKGHPPIKALLFGHVHSYSDFITYDGIRVLTNPSLSGIDGYAHSLGINYNLIGQLIFESTKDYVIGDTRLIRVASADNDKKYDTIIPEYKLDLSWNSHAKS